MPWRASNAQSDWSRDATKIAFSLDAWWDNRKEAAERLQISYKALLYKMKENGLSDRR